MSNLKRGLPAKWKLKSFIQRSCAALPGGGESVYYLLQRSVGSLRRPPDPIPMLQAAAEIIEELRTVDFDLHGKRVMEVGTGRRIDIPLAFYLAGAARTDTFDLHKYLRPELVMAAVRTILDNRALVTNLFAPLTDASALDSRMQALARADTFEKLVECTKIVCHAPADAVNTGLPDGSVDLQFSYTVFEHIPREILAGILKEASRVLSPEGLVCHHVDLSDHFAHEDASISFINFLQFEEDEWEKHSNNQYAYHNRLRVTDFEKLYAEVGHDVLIWQTIRDERSLQQLAEGFSLASRYRSAGMNELATTVVRITSKPGKRA